MISVLIPTYNDETHLPVAIASALQTDGVSEIIIVDDYSQDQTKKLIKELKKKSSKIKYHRNKKNLGSGISYIKALERAKFPYVCMLNSDDFFIPTGVSNLLKFLINNDLEIAYGKMAIKKNDEIFKFNHPGYWDQNYSNLRDEFKDLQIFDMYIPSFGTIIKRDIINVFYSQNYYERLMNDYGDEFKAHDYDLIINLAKKKKKIGFINEFVCVWCPKKDSQSAANYFLTGEAAYESAFLYNRYCDSRMFDYQTRCKIFKRINEKFENADENSKRSYSHLSKHYETFLKNINLKHSDVSSVGREV